jgi:hypothetical protein
MKTFKTCWISYALDGTDDDILLEDNRSSENNNSNDECDSSDEDFRGFCDQKKLHTTLPLFLVFVNLSFKCK